MSDLVDVEVENQISKLQHTQFELEMKLCDLCEEKIGVSLVQLIEELNKSNLRSNQWRSEYIRNKDRVDSLPKMGFIQVNRVPLLFSINN